MMRTHRSPWTPAERALLAEAYTRGGYPAVRGLLPHRHERAIYAQAFQLGLSAPNGKPKGVPRVKYEVTPQLDEQIRLRYLRPLLPGDMERFARSIGRPSWWIQKRASAIGCVVPRLKPLPWSADEIELLELHAHKAVAVIRRIFKGRGFIRTEASIGLQLKRRQIDREHPDCWSAGALAQLLGVDPKTVTRWIHAEALPAKRRGTHRHERQGGDEFVIERKKLRGWIATHQQLVDLRKVDRYWFMDLAFGVAA